MVFSAFRQDICQSSSLNTWSNIEVSGSSVPVDSSLNQSINQRYKLVLHFSFSTFQCTNKYSKILFSRQRQRRPDRAVYVPRGRRSQTTPPTAAAPNSGNVSKDQTLDKESATVIALTNSTTSPDHSSETTEKNSQETVIANKHKDTTTCEQQFHQQTSLACHEEKSLPQNPSPIANTSPIATMTDTIAKNECSKIESSLNSSDKDYNEERELQRASKVNLLI